MHKYVKAAIFIVLGLIVLVFALANRQTVVFSLDPFGSVDPNDPLVVSTPLFILAFALVIIGVLIGGIATWFRQGKYRRTARHLESEARALRAENERLRREADTRAISALPPRVPSAPSMGQAAGTHTE
jgi:uncharacterized integral membrane protein